MSLVVLSFHGRSLQVALIILIWFSFVRLVDSTGIESDCQPEQQKIMVSIRKDSNHVCGGTLIRGQWVLTAAHCEDTNLVVVAGLSQGPSEQVTSKVKHFYSHPEYTRPPNDDIAVIYLGTPIEENEFISYASLPGSNIAANCSKAIAMGWGKLWVGETIAYPNTTQCFEVSTMARSECVELIPWFRFDGLMCSLTLNTSKTCLDDFGGPILCDGVLIGIVSWQIECAEPFIPGVYARTDMYMQFIDSVLNGTPRAAECGCLLVSCSVLYFVKTIIKYVM